MTETSDRDHGRDNPSHRVDTGVTRQERGALDAASRRSPVASGPPSRSRVPVAPTQRPWVGHRFVRGLLFAVPLAIVLWALIIWAVAQLF